MTTETQILQELVEAVSRPDWWAIGITAVNAVIVIVLTLWQLCLNKRQTQIQERQNELQEEQTRLQKQQNELQEQQIKVQEYELLSKMYALVNDTEKITGNLINTLYNYFSSPALKMMDKNMLSTILKEIKLLKHNLYVLSIDFELKLSQKYLAPAYIDLLTETELVLQAFIDLEREGNMPRIKKDIEVNAVLMANRSKNPTIIIDAIVERISDVELREATKGMLIGYTHHRTSVLELEALADIKKCIKPDRTAM